MEPVETNLKKISFAPTVYNNEESKKVIDKQFKEFGQQGVSSEESSSDLVSKFFMDYEDLFYSIPLTGITGSHQYLAERSGQVSKIESGDSLVDIEPLLEEITLLRNQSIEDQQTILELNQELANLRLIISQSFEG